MVLNWLVKPTAGQDMCHQRGHFEWQTTKLLNAGPSRVVSMRLGGFDIRETPLRPLLSATASLRLREETWQS